LSNVHRRLVGTVNVSTGSNIIISYQGTANFLNDFQEGDTLYLSTGNTVTVREVTNANVAIVSSILNVSSTQVNANVVLVEYAKANSVNANTIITTTTFKANGSNLFATIQKVR
jgi:5-deoxy-D-glucuronate isomerase